MSNLNQDRRGSNRDLTSLSAVVKGRESAEVFWKENTKIVTVSKLGASFNLQRECKLGRIISLIVKMPPHLRCYDHEMNLYRVWGLVQHCSPISQNNAFHVGVAFIGKYAPEHYLSDPLKTYRITGMDKDGFWNVGATKLPFVSRAHHRFPSPLGIKIAAIDSEGVQTNIDYDAVTENISAGGASVFTSLKADFGDVVSFTCEQHGFTTTAVVRNRQNREGDRATLHIEFSEAKFPVMDLDLKFEDDEDIDKTVLDENVGDTAGLEDLETLVGAENTDIGDDEAADLLELSEPGEFGDDSDVAGDDEAAASEVDQDAGSSDTEDLESDGEDSDEDEESDDTDGDAEDSDDDDDDDDEDEMESDDDAEEEDAEDPDDDDDADDDDADDDDAEEEDAEDPDDDDDAKGSDDEE